MNHAILFLNVLRIYMDHYTTFHISVRRTQTCSNRAPTPKGSGPYTAYAFLVLKNQQIISVLSVNLPRRVLYMTAYEPDPKLRHENKMAAIVGEL